MRHLTVAVIGNPNSGKTTIFNALTDSNQRVGNWSGVTVECHTGSCCIDDMELTVVDLPGVYSLTIASNDGAIDSRIATEYLLYHRPDYIINVLDATNLERSLYLTTQLLELRIPVVLAVNMIDIAKRRNIHIDIDDLSKALAPAVAIVANKRKGISELKNLVVSEKKFKNPVNFVLPYPNKISEKLGNLEIQLRQNKYDIAIQFTAIRLLEGDFYAKQRVTQDVVRLSCQHQLDLVEFFKEDADVLIADVRYKFIHQLVSKVINKGKQIKSKRTVTSLIDNVVLNRVLGIPIFLMIMYLMFLFAINVGEVLQSFFDVGSNLLFVQGLRHLLLYLHLPNWLVEIFAVGVGKGISTTITFIPVIGCMFLFLSFLEDSGYMVRAVFVIDRLMSILGLPGGAFVPMIVGFGCNVPAIMASRTLENRKDRVLTVLMIPFMSCGARLAIYAIFTAAFFPDGGQNVVFVLYIIGILMAVVTGFILRSTLLKGKQSTLVSELPAYHFPVFRNILVYTWYRLKSFIVSAGKFILPVCILISALNSIDTNGNVITGGANQYSILAIIGKKVTPIFSPMGINNDNWPATVGLISGVLAKEIVVGTLNTLYMQTGNSSVSNSKSQSNLESLSDSNSLHYFRRHILQYITWHKVDNFVYGEMYRRFAGKSAAFAYLLFVLLYFPCIAATAMISQELGKAWAAFSVFWTTGIAYIVAVSFYQIATFKQHIGSSITLLVIMMSVFSLLVAIMGYFTKDYEIS